MKTNAIATINNVAIVVIDEREKFVPIRPICDALGIDPDSQRKRIERDEILNSVKVMMTATGSDGKEYEMISIPLKFVFGWLFSIDTSRVNEEARESVIRYKQECYEVLYRYFSEPQYYLSEKQGLVRSYSDELKLAKRNFRNAKALMDEAQKRFDEVMDYSIDTWRANNQQFVLTFNNEEE